MKLLSVAKPQGMLIVTKSSAPFRRQITMINYGAIFVVAFILGIALGAVQRSYLLFAVIAFVILFALAIQAVELRRNSNDDIFLFDKETDKFTYNRKPVTSLKSIEYVLVRHIREEDDQPEAEELALVISYDEGRRITLAESSKLPGAKEEILAAAQEIADYLDVPIEEGMRTPDEAWMDSYHSSV